MAIQKGHIKYVGTLGDVRHFKIKGLPGGKFANSDHHFSFGCDHSFSLDIDHPFSLQVDHPERYERAVVLAA